jgi:hypothetical protein
MSVVEALRQILSEPPLHRSHQFALAALALVASEGGRSHAD